MPYSEIDTARLVRMPEPPTGRCDVVIDTDAANEIDDQFAIVHALLSDVLNVEAVYAAPFHPPWTETSGPDEGMELSYAVGAWLLDPDWTRSHLTPSQIFNDGLRYSFDPTRHPVRVLTRIDRDAVFRDFFEKLDALQQ